MSYLEDTMEIDFATTTKRHRDYDNQLKIIDAMYQFLKENNEGQSKYDKYFLRIMKRHNII